MVRDIATLIERLYRVRSTVDRYDFVLAAIPVGLLGAVLVGSVFDVPLEAALPGGLAVALLALIDGLFLRPPSGLQGV